MVLVVSLSDNESSEEGGEEITVEKETSQSAAVWDLVPDQVSPERADETEKIKQLQAIRSR